MNPELVEAVRTKRIVLFAGAGISIPLGLPSWSDLIRSLAPDLGFDPAVFETLGDNLELAEYYELKKASLGLLRSQMDLAWHDPSIKDKVKASAIHKSIVDLQFPIIYTTNYDRWLEEAHKEFGRPAHVIRNISDLSLTSTSKTQIVKFHGDFSDDESLVLTESSYFDRLDFESPLDVKLRNDILGKTVLFIGYNLADVNIRLLFFLLQRQWRESKFSTKQPRSFILMRRPNPVRDEVFRSRGIEPIHASSDDHVKGLTSFLADLQAAVV